MDLRVRTRDGRSCRKCRHGSHRQLRIEWLEHRTLLAARLTFQGADYLATTGEPIFVASVDLDGDDVLDVIVADRQSGRVTVQMAKGDGTFGRHV